MIIKTNHANVNQLAPASPENEQGLKDEDILKFAAISDSLEAVLQEDLRMALTEPYKVAIADNGIGENADEKNVKFALVDATRNVLEDEIPIVWQPIEDMNYIYAPTERCYVAINPSLLSRMLLSIANEAHAQLRKENTIRPKMPTPAELSKAFAANIGPTGNAQREVDQWATMIFKNRFISLTETYGRRVSSDPLTKDIFHKQTLKVDFVEVTKPPEIWTKFCQDIGYGEPEMQAALEDISFYLVAPSIARHEAIFLLGSGRNGKSVYLNFFKKIIGSRFVGATSLEQFQKNFGLEPLLNKKLSLSSESGTNDFVDSKTFKAIVSGDPIQVDRKGVTAVTVTLPLKLAFALNEDPVIADSSDGMYARVRVLRFLNEIPAGQRIDRYEDYLFKYGSQIVSWWVYSHFLRHGKLNLKFSLPQIFEQWKNEIFVTGTDPIEAFIAKCIEEAPGQRASFQEILTEFKIFSMTHNWSRNGRLSSMSPHTLGRKVVGTYRRMYGKKLESRPSNGIRYYFDIQLKPAIKKMY